MAPVIIVVVSSVALPFSLVTALFGLLYCAVCLVYYGGSTVAPAGDDSTQLLRLIHVAAAPTGSAESTLLLQSLRGVTVAAAPCSCSATSLGG